MDDRTPDAYYHARLAHVGAQIAEYRPGVDVKEIPSHFVLQTEDPLDSCIGWGLSSLQVGYGTVAFCETIRWERSNSVTVVDVLAQLVLRQNQLHGVVFVTVCAAPENRYPLPESAPV